MLLLDLEGENGTIPLTLKEDAKIFRVGDIEQRLLFASVISILATQKAVKAALKKNGPKGPKGETKKVMKKVLDNRMGWIKEQLPQLAYLISNILVFVDRQPMHNKK